MTRFGLLLPHFGVEADRDLLVESAQLAERLGFGKELVKNYKMVQGKGGMEPEVESILREINRSVWTIGYTGQTPERLKAHMRNMHVFYVKTLRAKLKLVAPTLEPIRTHRGAGYALAEDLPATLT